MKRGVSRRRGAKIGVVSGRGYKNGRGKCSRYSTRFLDFF